MLDRAAFKTEPSNHTASLRVFPGLTTAILRARLLIQGTVGRGMTFFTAPVTDEVATPGRSKLLVPSVMCDLGVLGPALLFGHLGLSRLFVLFVVLAPPTTAVWGSVGTLGCAAINCGWIGTWRLLSGVTHGCTLSIENNCGQKEVAKSRSEIPRPTVRSLPDSHISDMSFCVLLLSL